jgi:hypothetical protein
MANIYQKQCAFKVDLQAMVRSLESTLSPVELLLFISWLTETLDWDTRRLLLYQLSLDWSSDLAQDLKEIIDLDSDRDLKELREALLAISTVLKDNLRTIEEFMRQTDADPTVPEEENSRRSER